MASDVADTCAALCSDHLKGVEGHYATVRITGMDTPCVWCQQEEGPTRQADYLIELTMYRSVDEDA